MTALISVCMLWRANTVEPEPSATTTPSTRAEKAHPGFVPLTTDLPVKMKLSLSWLWSAIWDSTSAWAATGAYCLHSLPSVVMNVVKRSCWSSMLVQASNYLTLSTEVQDSIVLLACVNHDVPIFKRHFATLQLSHGVGCLGRQIPGQRLSPVQACGG